MMQAFAGGASVGFSRQHVRRSVERSRPGICCRIGRIGGTGGDSIRTASEEYKSEVADAERKYGRRSVAKQREIDSTVAAAAEYKRLRRRLYGDTLFMGVLWCASCWSFGSVIECQSAVVGGVASLFYVYLLSPDVQSLQEGGGKIMESGKNKQPVRLLLLPLLVLGIAKSNGVLHILPAVVGFFSYKLALVLPLISGEAFSD